MKEVEVKEVVITTLARAGRGVQADPIRIVLQVWDKSGELIAERDDFLLAKMKEPDLGPSNIEPFDLDREPLILAGFGRIYKEHQYPEKEWYQAVYHEINHIYRAEPTSTYRFQIQKNTLFWLNKKIESMP